MIVASENRRVQKARRDERSRLSGSSFSSELSTTSESSVCSSNSKQGMAQTKDDLEAIQAKCACVPTAACAPGLARSLIELRRRGHRTFCKWLNSKLQLRGIEPMTSLAVDLSNGVRLAQLLVSPTRVSSCARF